MLKSRISSSFIWSALNTGGTQIVGLIYGIILARLLSPADFGIIAIILFIILISNVFVDFGLCQSLIRDQNVTKADYNSVFFFSLFFGSIITFSIFLLSNILSSFYEINNLDNLIKIMSLCPFIHSLTVVNSTIITKNLDFKLKSKLSLSAITISGLCSIIMALNGFGIWSLVIFQLSNTFLLMIFLWMKVKWKPELYFSSKSIIKHFHFGLKISLSNLANILNTKIFVIVLGKYFSLSDVGYFTRADNLKNIPNEMISKVIARVSFPLLSKLQKDEADLRAKNILIIKYTGILTIPLMLGLASVTEQLIVVLIGIKWLPSSNILLYLCFAGIFIPFDKINMNAIKVYGKINTHLTIEIVRLIMIIPVLISGVLIGLKAMLVSIVIHSFLSFILSGAISGKIVNYNLFKYLSDLIQPIMFSLFMFLIINILQYYIELNYLYELLFSITIGILIMIFLYEFFKNKEYIEIKKTVMVKFKK